MGGQGSARQEEGPHEGARDPLPGGRSPKPMCRTSSAGEGLLRAGQQPRPLLLPRLGATPPLAAQLLPGFPGSFPPFLPYLTSTPPKKHPPQPLQYPRPSIWLRTLRQTPGPALHPVRGGPRLRGPPPSFSPFPFCDGQGQHYCCYCYCCCCLGCCCCCCPGCCCCPPHGYCCCSPQD